MTKHEGFIWKKQFRPAEGATRHRLSLTTSGAGLLNKGCTEPTFAVFALVVHGEVQQRQEVVIVQQHLMSCLLEGYVYICGKEIT